MNTSIKTLLLVIVLAGVGFLLLPYVKLNPKQPQTTSQNSNQTPPPPPPATSGSGNVQTFSSDDWGVTFQYAKDQDGDGKDDTTATESGDKIYVYYTASPKESGQWVQVFTKDPKLSLADAVKAKFLPGIAAKDCFVTDMAAFYAKYNAQISAPPANTDRVIIAYPFPTDQSQPFNEFAAKCPQDYSLTNGLSYFQMDKAHPDKYYFFSLGQYPILADTKAQTTWQDTFKVTK